MAQPKPNFKRPTNSVASRKPNFNRSAYRADFNRSVVPSDFVPFEVQASHIADVRQALKSDWDQHSKIVDKFPVKRETYKAFLENDALDRKIAAFFNKNILGDMSYSELAGHLKNLPVYRSVSEYQFKGEYFNLAQIADANKDLGSTIAHYLTLVLTAVEFEKERDYINEETGKRTIETYMHFQCNTEINKRKDPGYGIYDYEGELNQKYLRTPPGGKSIKISKSAAMFLKERSSRGLRMIQGNKILYTTVVKNQKWYVKALEAIRENKSQETMNMLNDRLYKAVDHMMDVASYEVVYFSRNYDYRYRMYYDTPAYYMNLQSYGKYLFTRTKANATVPTESGNKWLIYAAVVKAFGRMSKFKAFHLWNKSEQLVRDTLLDKYSDDVSEYLYCYRLLNAIDDYRAGRESDFILYYDFTTGGLIHASLGFKDEKAAELCNIAGKKTPKNAHGEASSALGLGDIDAGKPINMGLIHGSNIDTIYKKLHANNDSFVLTNEEFLLRVNKLYGHIIDNIGMIVEYGRQAYSRENPMLLCTTPEGWKTGSVAFTDSKYVDPQTGETKYNKYFAYVLDVNKSKGYSIYTTVTKMPLNNSNDGKFLPGSKTNGLFANLTHILDAWLMRYIIIRMNYAIDVDIHDNIGADCNLFDEIHTYAIDGMILEGKGNHYKRMLVEIHENGSGFMPSVPNLIYGKLDPKVVMRSEMFLQA